MNVNVLKCAVHKYSMNKPASSTSTSPSRSTLKDYRVQYILSPPATSQEQAAFLTGLRQLFPKAAVLTATFLQPDVRSSSGAPALHRLPATISALYHQKYAKLSRSRLLAECKTVFQEMKISTDEADYLVEATHYSWSVWSGLNIDAVF